MDYINNSAGSRSHILKGGWKCITRMSMLYLSSMIINLSVRPITKQDYDQWIPLWEGYNAFYKRSGPTALSPEITQTTWNRFFDESEPVFAMVAAYDGK